MPPLFTRPFGLLVGGHFLQALGYSSMLLLPLYLVSLQASRAEIGAIMAVASVGALLLRPVVGWALDHLGRRPTLVFGTTLLALGMGLIGAVTSVGPLAYVARIVFGIGEGFVFAGYFTFASDLVPTARRTEGLAIFGVSGLLPLALNPVVGRLGIEAADIRFYLPALGIIVLVSSLMLLPIPEPVIEQPTEGRGAGPALRAMVVRRLWPVWLVTLAFSGLVATFMSFASVAAERRGVADPAGLWLTYALSATVVRLVGARIPDRIGPRNLVVPAMAVYAYGAVVLASASTASAFLFAGALGGFGHGYGFPVLSSQVVTRSPAHLRGTALAAFTGLWELAALAATPFLGFYADAYGDGAMFSLTAVVVLGCLVGWAFLEHRHGGEVPLLSGPPTPESQRAAADPP